MAINFKITDVNEEEFTSADISGLNYRLYEIDTAIGDLVKYAYIYKSSVAARITEINVYVLSAVTLDGEIQYYKEGVITNNASWIKNSTYDFSFIAAEAQTYNDVVTSDEILLTSPIRVKLETSAAATIRIKVIGK